MRKGKLVLALALVLMLIFQTVAFAASAPTSIVVIGDKAFSLTYANDSAHRAEILAAIIASGNKIYVKSPSGAWYDNANGGIVPAATIPAFTMGTTSYAAGDVQVSPTPTNTPTPTAVPATSTPVPTVAPTATPIPADTTAPTMGTASFVDYKTIMIPFSEKVTGNASVTISNSGAPVSVDSATLSADGTYLTVVKNAGYNAGTYFVTVNGIKDVANNALAANSSQNVVKDASYAATFEIPTIGVPPTSANNTTLVYFIAKDQYGKTVDFASNASLDDGLLVNAKIGSYPLSGTLNASAGTFAINGDDAIVEKAVIDFTISNFVSGVVKGTASTQLTVGKTKAAAAISAVSFANANTSPVAGGSAVVNVSVLDQYNRPIANSDIRWTVSDSTVATLPGGVAVYDNTADSVTVTFVKAGSVTITAFLKNNVGVSKSMTINVGATPLATITTPSFTVVNKFNKESVVSDALSYTAGASLTPSMLKFKVTSKPATATDNDIVISAAYGTGANASNIYITVVTQVAGAYAFDTYVGDSYTAQNVIKSGTVNVTTTVNPAVSSIELAAIGTNELTATQAINKAITFKNKHGEIVDVTESNLSVITTSNLTVQEWTADVDGKPNAAAGANEAVKFLNITAGAAGNDTISIVTGAASLLVNTTAVAASVPTTMALDQGSVEVILDDTLDVATPKNTDSTVIIGGNTYIAIPMVFRDQYQNKIDVTQANGYSISVTGTDSNTVPATLILDALLNSNNSIAGNGDSMKYIAVAAFSTGTADTTQAITVALTKTVNNIPTTVSSANLMVTVKDARVLTSLSSSPSSASVVKGASNVFTVSGKDQYNTAFSLPTPARLKMVAAQNAEYTANIATASSGKAKITVTGNTTSPNAYTVTLYYDANNDGILNNGEKSVNVSLTVKEIGDVVNSIAIQGSVTEAVYNAGANISADLTSYKAKIDIGGANAYTFTTKAYDTSNGAVSLASSSLIYSVVGNTLKVDGNAPAANAFAISMNNNVLTVNTANVAQGAVITGTITVRAISTNGKTSDIVMTFDNTVAAPKAGEYYLGTTSTGLKEDQVTAVEIKNADTNKSVYVIGVDQYGQIFNVSEAGLLGTGIDNSQYFTAVVNNNNTANDLTDDMIVITPSNTRVYGTTNLRIFINVNESIVLPVTISNK